MSGIEEKHESSKEEELLKDEKLHTDCSRESEEGISFTKLDTHLKVSSCVPDSLDIQGDYFLRSSISPAHSRSSISPAHSRSSISPAHSRLSVPPVATSKSSIPPDLSRQIPFSQDTIESLEQIILSTKILKEGIVLAKEKGMISMADIIRENIDNISIKASATLDGLSQVMINLLYVNTKNNELVDENEELEKRVDYLMKEIFDIMSTNVFIKELIDTKSIDKLVDEIIKNGNGGSIKKDISLSDLCLDNSEKQILIENKILNDIIEQNEKLVLINQKLRTKESFLKEKLIEIKENIKRHSLSCGCDKRSFKSITEGENAGEPLLGLAKSLYDVAYKQRIKINEEKESKKELLIKEIKNVLLEVMKDINVNVRGRRNNRKKIINERVNLIAKETACALVNTKNIEKHEVYRVINRVFLYYTKDFKTEKIRKMNPRNMRKIFSVLGVNTEIKPYFKGMRECVRDAMTMNIPLVWREKIDKNTGESYLDQYAGNKANEYAKNLLGDYQLDPEIADTNSIVELQKIITDGMSKKEYLPINEKNLKRIMSAVTKIRFMHLAETIRLNIDFVKNNNLEIHLREKLKRFLTKDKNGNKVLTLNSSFIGREYDLDDMFDPLSTVIKSLSVRSSKDEISIARKMYVKDSFYGKDYGVSDIKDFLGLRIEFMDRELDKAFLDDEYSVTPAQYSTEKILSLIMAIFGSDVPEGRLRHSFPIEELPELGTNNSFSTGKHKAFQLTCRYRHQCNSSGLTEDGNYIGGIIPVEIQIAQGMDKNERDEDHEDYRSRKDKEIQKITGMDRPFHVWLSDIADVLLSEDELVCSAQSPLNKTEITHKEFLAKILFLSLTERDKNGELINNDQLRRLFKDKDIKDKIKKLTKSYLDYKPLVLRRKIKNGHIESENNHIRILAEKSLKVIDTF